MQRNEAKSKSLRKVLRDLSNLNNNPPISSKSVTTKKKLATTAKQNKKEENVWVSKEEENQCLDRLLLVQSDLSSLARQIDELVAEAFKLKSTSNEARNEIDSFSNFLSNMLSSLKPWVPRFRVVLSEPEIRSGQYLIDENKNVSDNVENSNVESPEESKLESLISPSPLVSWRPDCNVERGRHLFLLTPLPISKTLSFAHQELSKSRVGSSSVVEVPSVLAICRGGNDDDLIENVGVKERTPCKATSFSVNEGKMGFDCGFVSSPVVVKGKHSMLVMTPCMKMSPPKSCVLLEPVLESTRKGFDRLRKSTPFPVGIQLHISDSSGSDESPEDLALKYPELLGLQRAYKSRMGKELDASPNWSFSPPKTCVLLEPQDEKSLDFGDDNHNLPINAPALNQQTNLILPKQNDVQVGCHQIKKSVNQEKAIGGSMTVVESTPVWKEPQSTLRTGKCPGENTLKRELWTKFEAASTYGFHLNASAFRGTAQKGFLDMLDEVSCDEESPTADGFR